jgi:hypothetical protein
LAIAEGIRAARNVYDYGLRPGPREEPELIVYEPESDEADTSSSDNAQENESNSVQEEELVR